LRCAKVFEESHCRKKRFNPLTPGTFDILVVLKLDRGQISFSQVENALVARQLAVLATRIAFKTFWPRDAQKSKFLDRFWTRK